MTAQTSPGQTPSEHERLTQFAEEMRQLAADPRQVIQDSSLQAQAIILTGAAHPDADRVASRLFLAARHLGRRLELGEQEWRQIYAEFTELLQHSKGHRTTQRGQSRGLMREELEGLRLPEAGFNGVWQMEDRALNYSAALEHLQALSAPFRPWENPAAWPDSTGMHLAMRLSLIPEPRGAVSLYEALGPEWRAQHLAAGLSRALNADPRAVYELRGMTREDIASLTAWAQEAGENERHWLTCLTEMYPQGGRELLFPKRRNSKLTPQLLEDLALIRHPLYQEMDPSGKHQTPELRTADQVPGLVETFFRQKAGIERRLGGLAFHPEVEVGALAQLMGELAGAEGAPEMLQSVVRDLDSYEAHNTPGNMLLMRLGGNPGARRASKLQLGSQRNNALNLGAWQELLSAVEAEARAFPADALLAEYNTGLPKEPWQDESYVQKIGYRLPVPGGARVRWVAERVGAVYAPELLGTAHRLDPQQLQVQEVWLRIMRHCEPLLWPSSTPGISALQAVSVGLIGARLDRLDQAQGKAGA